MIWHPTAQWHKGLTLFPRRSRSQPAELCAAGHMLYSSSRVSERTPSEPSSLSPRLMSGELRILPGMFHKLNSRGWDRKQKEKKSTAQKELSLFLSVTQQLPLAKASFSPSSILSFTFNDYLACQGSA